MKREMNKLTVDERINMIADINTVMSSKYDISDTSIKSFWNMLNVGNQCIRNA